MMNGEHTSDGAETSMPASTVDDMFGFCPDCVANGTYGAELTCRGVARTDYFCCDKHNCYWEFGWNWHLDPRGESYEVWRSNDEKLETMRKVEPRHLPETERRMAEIERRRKARVHRGRLIMELADHLSDEQQEVVIRQLREMTSVIVENGRIRPRDEDGLPF